MTSTIKVTLAGEVTDITDKNEAYKYMWRIVQREISDENECDNTYQNFLFYFQILQHREKKLGLMQKML